MTLPSLVLGAILASIFGSAYHLWRGGSGIRLLYYMFLAWVGFWGGHWLAQQGDWQFLNYGPLSIGPASLGSLAALSLGYWISSMQTS